MIEPRPDADLRHRFLQLRSEEREAAPDFTAMMAEARAALESGVEKRVDARAGRASAWLRSRKRWLWAGGSVAAAAAIALLMLLNPGARADREFEHAVRTYVAETGGWRTATDALLEFPGSEITRSVPRLGTMEWPGGTNPSRRDRS